MVGTAAIGIVTVAVAVTIVVHVVVTGLLRAGMHRGIPVIAVRAVVHVAGWRGLRLDLVVGVPEANAYYPFADIVWRGDPPGDRHAQITKLFTDAVQLAKPGLVGQIPVIADITLIRFHGVTEKTRASVGGVYNIVFTLQVRDAQTGAVLEPTREIEADLSAPGGTAAILLDREGQTEVVRVTDFLSYVLVKELGGLAH